MSYPLAIGSGAQFDTAQAVRTEDDLPNLTLKGGVNVHVLEEKHYVIDASASIANPLAPPGAGKTATITSLNRSVLTYTGTDSLFYDDDAEGNIEVSGLTEFRAPSGNMWDLTAVTGSFSFQSSGGACKFAECLSLGTVTCNGTSGFNLDFGSISDFNQGLVVNDPTFFEVSTNFVFGNNAVGCTYFTVQGANTSGSVNFDTLTASNGTNETLFYLDPNIQAGVDAVNIRGCSEEGGVNGSIFGAGSLTQKDAKVRAAGNTIIDNTNPGCLLSMTGNATATEIVAINTPTLVAGTWAIIDSSHGTGTTSGRYTYEGTTPITSDIDAVLSVEPASSNGIVLRAYIAKNGSEIVASGKSTTADNGKAQLITISWRETLNTGDYYEIFIENKTNGIFPVVIDSTMRIP